MAVLALEAVEKRFGGLPAVDGVTLEVDDGEILAIVGPNGAGKSTLLKLIAGLDTPTAGRILFQGRNLVGSLPHRTRHLGIATVLQTPKTFSSLTVEENVLLGAMFGGPEGLLNEDDARDRAAEALSFVGLDHRARHPVSTLNLHDQRFLELARAISGHPRLLLLDEVMAGLNDTELTASIEIVRTIRDQLGVTVIWVEHVMKAVMDLAERAVVLDFGRVLAEGTPHEVMRDPSVIAAYLGTEAQTGA
ncbi:MAG: ABC transporter ATP-binding protein [Acidimicrobiia bacterium]